MKDRLWIDKVREDGKRKDITWSKIQSQKANRGTNIKLNSTSVTLTCRMSYDHESN